LSLRRLTWPATERLLVDALNKDALKVGGTRQEQRERLEGEIRSLIDLCRGLLDPSAEFSAEDTDRQLTLRAFSAAG
jgi:hypothetical protein